jgi:N-acetylglutamate synthase-like GNAT family acetyltransferase
VSASPSHGRTVIVRPAGPHDGDVIRDLLAELDYPTDAETMTGRIERIAAEPSARVLVAEREGSVVGFASVHILHLIERPALGRLSAISVTRSERCRGVGRALVKCVEEEARASGCDRLELTSGEWREDAHAFYRDLGFEETSKRFIKAL